MSQTTWVTTRRGRGAPCSAAARGTARKWSPSRRAASRSASRPRGKSATVAIRWRGRMPADAATMEAAKQKRRGALKAVRRDGILQAARAVFARDGLDGATLRAIAAEAGIAVGTVYLHFPTKEVLYAEMLASSLADLQKALREAVARTVPEDQLLAAALGFYGFYRVRPDDLYPDLFPPPVSKPQNGSAPHQERVG